eukprot:s1278_g7.t2
MQCDVGAASTGGKVRSVTAKFAQALRSWSKDCNISPMHDLDMLQELQGTEVQRHQNVQRWMQHVKSFSAKERSTWTSETSLAENTLDDFKEAHFAQARTKKTPSRSMAKHLVAEKLGPTFGQGGDFTVVVEERHAEGVEGDTSAEPKRTEFKVWSVILSAWSEVFEKMLSRDFVESTKKEVVIKDFTSFAVETFLKFLYKGSVENVPPERLCEVSAIADKYQVLQLKNLCLRIVEDAINVKNAWAIFQSADELQMKDIRQKSKDKILTEAKEAFETRPLVRDELLEEVFSSNLMCITDEELLPILKTWKDPPDQISSQTLVDRWVSMAKTPKRKRGEHATDLIRCVKSRFDTFSQGQTSQGRAWPREPSLSRPLFLANWVSVSYDLANAYLTPDAYQIAEGNATCKLQAGDWIEWRLPKFSAHLMAIRFTEVLRSIDHLEIFCAADCSGWHRVFSSRDYCGSGSSIFGGGIGRNTVVKCGCQDLVQRFKLHMISGQFQLPGISFEGILAEI